MVLPLFFLPADPLRDGNRLILQGTREIPIPDTFPEVLKKKGGDAAETFVLRYMRQFVNQQSAIALPFFTDQNPVSESDSDRSAECFLKCGGNAIEKGTLENFDAVHEPHVDPLRMLHSSCTRILNLVRSQPTTKTTG